MSGGYEMMACPTLCLRHRVEKSIKLHFLNVESAVQVGHMRSAESSLMKC
jgi:hypothetical protein